MNDDLIKRSDAIEAIEVVDWYHQNCNKDMVHGANSNIHQAWYKSQDIYEALENVPFVDRPQGKWIRDRYWSRGIGMGEEYGFFYKCSMCEYEVEGEYTRCGFNYCPNCGADMRKGADDETD